MSLADINTKYNLTWIQVKSLFYHRVIIPFRKNEFAYDYMDKNLYEKFKVWIDIKAQTKVKKTTSTTTQERKEYYVTEDKDTKGLPCLLEDLDYSFKKCRNPLWGDEKRPDKDTSFYCGKPVTRLKYTFCEDCFPKLSVERSLDTRYSAKVLQFKGNW
jgi:hypothetical protein